MRSRSDGRTTCGLGTDPLRMELSLAMPDTTAPRRSPLRSFLRWGFPWVVVAGGALGLAALWLLPAEILERGVRGISSVALSLLSLLLLAVWLLFFSPLRWWQAGGVLALCFVALLGAVQQVKLTGDWVPLFVFRWDNAPRYSSAAREPNVAALAQLDLRRLRDTDFPEYRGRRRDGVVHGPPLSRDWTAKPPPLLWRQPAGGGYASFAVAGTAAVTIEQRDDKEAIVCYDVNTGQVLWIHAYPAHFQEWQGGSGPRATPTIADGDVYSLGAAGRLVCLDGKTGGLKWSVDVLADNENIRWGMSGSPLVFDDTVVVNPGVQKETAAGRALVAYRRSSGEVAWTAGNTRAGYSSPMLATLAGRRQILLFDGEQIAGYDTAGNGVLWSYPWKTQEGINVAQPLVLDDDRVFVSSGYGVGGAMLKVSLAEGKFQVEQLWKKATLQSKFANPVYRNGFIYGLDNGVLACVDVKDGTRKWKGERYGHGQVLLSGDLLVILSEEGELVLAHATPEEPRELGRIKAFTAKTRTWNSHALADGKAFVRNDLEMACFDLRGH